MKKLAVILALAMISVSFCACGGTQETSQSTQSVNEISSPGQTSEQSSQTVVNAKVGDLLDKPEKVFSGSQLYCSFQVPSTTNESGVQTAEFAVKDNDDSGVLYLSDGALKLNEEVLINNSDGTITRYYKDLSTDGFVLDTTSSTTELDKRKQEAMSFLMAAGYGVIDSLDSNVTKYKKCEDQNDPLTGDAYVYDVIENGEKSNTLWINKETGVFVKMLDKDGNWQMKMQEIKVTDVEIPEYK